VLPNDVRLSIGRDAEVFVKADEVWQTGGTIAYTVGGQSNPSHDEAFFAVRIPQGVVQTMEGASVYEISVIPGKSTVLQVESGRVRIISNRQSELIVKAGEVASLEEARSPMLLHPSPTTERSYRP